MIANAHQMQCGSCGCRLFQVYELPSERLVVECNSCKSTTLVSPTAKLALDWGEKSEGVLCPVLEEKRRDGT